MSSAEGPRSNNQRYVVTGGCGFIGRHLVAALVQRGAQVVVLDDLSNSTATGLPPQVDLVVGSVADPERVAQVMAQADGCFHLAAIASVPECQQNWLRAHQVNSGGTVTVLNAARQTTDRAAVPVVFASSAAVYGDQSIFPITEQAQTLPQSVYGADKLASEVSGTVAASSFNVPFTALRFFNVYGPGQNPSSPYSGVISKFVEQALAGRRQTIFGDGGQTRDFVHVTDVVRHLMAAMDTPKSEARILNVCSAQETTINELAQMICDLASSSAEIVYAPHQGFEIVRSLGDNSSSRAALGLVADHPLSAGLAELITSLRAERVDGLGTPPDGPRNSTID
jgi:UDP-glucose 4-epimerase